MILVEVETMTNPRTSFMLFALVLWGLLCVAFTNNGQHVRATVGQQIEITLGTLSPAQYGVPMVSSTAVRLESTALNWPPNPGGPTFVYIFEAAAAGEAQVIIPILHSPEPDFAKKKYFCSNHSS